MDEKFWADLYMHSCFTKILIGTEGKFSLCNNAFPEWKGLWTVMTNHLSLPETEVFLNIQKFGAKTRQIQVNWEDWSPYVYLP